MAAGHRDEIKIDKITSGPLLALRGGKPQHRLDGGEKIDGAELMCGVMVAGRDDPCRFIKHHPGPCSPAIAQEWQRALSTAHDAQTARVNAETLATRLQSEVGALTDLVQRLSERDDAQLTDATVLVARMLVDDGAVPSERALDLADNLVEVLRTLLRGEFMSTVAVQLVSERDEAKAQVHALRNRVIEAERRLQAAQGALGRQRRTTAPAWYQDDDDVVDDVTRYTTRSDKIGEDGRAYAVGTNDAAYTTRDAQEAVYRQLLAEQGKRLRLRDSS